MSIYGCQQAEANKFRHRITVGDGLFFFAGLCIDSRRMPVKGTAHDLPECPSLQFVPKSPLDFAESSSTFCRMILPDLKSTDFRPC